MKIRIGITQGDINGIGYEVIFKAFSCEDMLDMCVPVIYGNEKIANYHRNSLEEAPAFTVVGHADEAQPGRLNLINTNAEECSVEYGKSTAASGRQAQAALRRAVSDWKAGLIDVIVTAPICKSAIRSDSFPFVGHTEYFENTTGENGLMILSNPALRVALATTHLPISEVARSITPELLSEKLRLLHKALLRDFRISAPRIAVLGLNPHSGDEGTLGKEEKEIIGPTIENLRKEGVPCFGPYPADGFFGEGAYRQFDAVLAMYHDQGLAPLKALGMDEGVNFTAGLSIIRTSPDHGTAYDIAGKNQASEASMRQAIYTAIDIFRNRTEYDEITANPLPFTQRRIEHERLPKA